MYWLSRRGVLSALLARCSTLAFGMSANQCLQVRLSLLSLLSAPSQYRPGRTTGGKRLPLLSNRVTFVILS